MAGRAGSGRAAPRSRDGGRRRGGLLRRPASRHGSHHVLRPCVRWRFVSSAACHSVRRHSGKLRAPGQEFALPAETAMVEARGCSSLRRRKRIGPSGQPAPSLWSRLNRPLVPGVIAFLGWLGFALARWQIWAKGHLSLFIMAGHVYTHRGQLPRGLLLVPSAGYDGQFYYRLALDPANWSATAFGITMDQSYRYTRIGYPRPGLAAVARPAPARARRPGRDQPARGGGHGRARRHVRPRVRPPRPVGARLRRLLRPGHQRRPGHRRAAGRGVHAGRAARLPPRRQPGQVRARHRRCSPSARSPGKPSCSPPRPSPSPGSSRWPAAGPGPAWPT